MRLAAGDVKVKKNECFFILTAEIIRNKKMWW